MTAQALKTLHRFGHFHILQGPQGQKALRYRWRSARSSLLFITAAAIWFALAIYLMGIGAGLAWLYIPLLLLGTGFVGLAAAWWFNQTDIMLQNQCLLVRHHPLPIRKHRNIPLEQLQDVFVHSHKITENDVQHEVHAMVKGQQHFPLIAADLITSAQEAKDLCYAIRLIAKLPPETLSQ